MKAGEVTQPIAVPKGGYRILKLIAKERAGQREITDPQVQTSIRDMLRNRKEQLLRSAYLVEARDESHVTNYLARQIIESAGEKPSFMTNKSPDTRSHKKENNKNMSLSCV